MMGNIDGFVRYTWYLEHHGVYHDRKKDKLKSIFLMVQEDVRVCRHLLLVWNCEFFLFMFVKNMQLLWLSSFCKALLIWWECKSRPFYLLLCW